MDAAEGALIPEKVDQIKNLSMYYWNTHAPDNLKDEPEMFMHFHALFEQATTIKTTFEDTSINLPSELSIFFQLAKYIAEKQNQGEFPTDILQYAYFATYDVGNLGIINDKFGMNVGDQIVARHLQNFEKLRGKRYLVFAGRAPSDEGSVIIIPPDELRNQFKKDPQKVLEDALENAETDTAQKEASNQDLEALYKRTLHIKSLRQICPTSGQHRAGSILKHLINQTESEVTSLEPNDINAIADIFKLIDYLVDPLIESDYDYPQSRYSSSIAKLVENLETNLVDHDPKSNKFRRFIHALAFQATFDQLFKRELNVFYPDMFDEVVREQLQYGVQDGEVIMISARNLKKVNNVSHAAGDEVIENAMDCINDTLTQCGLSEKATKAKLSGALFVFIPHGNLQQIENADMFTQTLASLSESKGLSLTTTSLALEPKHINALREGKTVWDLIEEPIYKPQLEILKYHLSSLDANNPDALAEFKSISFRQKHYLEEIIDQVKMLRKGSKESENELIYFIRERIDRRIKPYINLLLSMLQLPQLMSPATSSTPA
jgi:GGDEF domain-containing protein